MFTLKVDDEITLRLHDPYDIEAYHNLINANRDHIGRYMDWVDSHPTLADTHGYMLSARKEFGNRNGVATKIFYRGELVGSAGFGLWDKTTRIGEVGYWLAESATGKGIATRAARAMVDYAFATLGMHKVIIRAMTSNAASIAIAKRLGFKHQGLDVQGKLHYGKYYDFDVYYMLADDWQPTLQSPEFSYVVGDGIELRIFEPHHANDAFAVTDANREFLRKWLPWVDSTISVDNTRQFVDATLKQYADNDGVQMGIWYNGEFCGACGYHYWDFVSKKTEIGYWLAEAYTGKGIMSRCVQALVDYAFAVQGLHRVEIMCATANHASCAIPQRLGFKQEGVIRSGSKVNNEYQDIYVYGILADEWASAR
jgi:ribosomal-protein-serine acetyltransferase